MGKVKKKGCNEPWEFGFLVGVDGTGWEVLNISKFSGWDESRQNKAN